MNVGLLQLHNTADIANNKQRLAEGIMTSPIAAQSSSCFKNFITPSISVR